jgi:hypothetical protein
VRANFDITAPPRYLPVKALAFQPIGAATTSSTSPRGLTIIELRVFARTLVSKLCPEKNPEDTPART